MKNIIKSLVIVVAVAAVAGGATYSLFYAFAVETGNTYSTGTLEVYLTGDATNASNMAPGQCKKTSFNLKNTGSLPIGTIALNANSWGGNNKLYDKLDVTVDRVGDAPGTHFFSGKLKDLIDKGNLISSNLASNDSITTDIDVCLPSDADDTYRGLSAAWSLKFDATQVH